MNPAAPREMLDRLEFSDEPYTGPLPTAEDVEQLRGDVAAYKLQLRQEATS